VVDAGGFSQVNLSVHAFDGWTYSGYSNTTNDDGQATFVLPNGNFRFRVDMPGRQFWSGETNHCTVPECTTVTVTVPYTVTVTVEDANDNPRPDVMVWVYDENTITSFYNLTDAQGQAWIYVPEGEYRFKTIADGVTYWSGPANHCTVPGCASASIELPAAVTVTSQHGGVPDAGMRVFAFSGDAYTGYYSDTNADGQATILLPPGQYRFRGDIGGQEFWSGSENHCTIPVCISASISTTTVTVTISNAVGHPEIGWSVQAYDGETPVGAARTTDGNGKVTLWLTSGSYRFRAERYAAVFWSAETNHCAVPSCTEVNMTSPAYPVTVTSQHGGIPDAGMRVFAFSGDEYTLYYGDTNVDGQVTILMPPGEYRFRGDIGGQEFWSGSENHCTVPDCTSAGISTTTVVVTITNAAGHPEIGWSVQVYDGETPVGPSRTTDGNGKVTLWLTTGSYRFRAARYAAVFWSGETNHCDVPSCSEVNMVSPSYPLTVTSQHGDLPDAGMRVFAFNGNTYTGYYGDTNADGQVTLLLPPGEYRFRGDIGGQEFWSGTENHCTVPDCTSASISTTTVTLTIANSAGHPEIGWSVQAYNGETSVGPSRTTDGNGKVTLWLTAGSYRFWAARYAAVFWSDETNHCAVPTCTEVEMTSPSTPVVVTALNTDIPVSGMRVFAFSGDAYTGYYGDTNGDGQVTLLLPPGQYRFRGDVGGQQYWSGSENHCRLPDCTSAVIDISGP